MNRKSSQKLREALYSNTPHSDRERTRKDNHTYNQYEHSAIPSNPSDTSAGSFKHSRITQSLDMKEKKKKSQKLQGEKRKKEEKLKQR